MDGNSKLGPDIIRGDPHAQTDNGKILAGIIERNALCVINNSSGKCKGKITRRRVTKRQTEESIIDFVLSCEDMEEIREVLIIKEDKEYALNSYRKPKTNLG